MREIGKRKTKENERNRKNVTALVSQRMPEVKMETATGRLHRSEADEKVKRQIRALKNIDEMCMDMVKSVANNAGPVDQARVDQIVSVLLEVADRYSEQMRGAYMLRVFDALRKIGGRATSRLVDFLEYNMDPARHTHRTNCLCPHVVSLLEDMGELKDMLPRLKRLADHGTDDSSVSRDLKTLCRRISKE